MPRTFKKTARKTTRPRRRTTGKATILKTVKSVLARRVETKMLDNASVDWDLDTYPYSAPLVFNTTYIAQGTGSSGRIGDSIYCKSVTLNVAMYYNTVTSPTQFCYVRMILFRDKQQVADTVPLTTMLLANTSSAALAITSPQTWVQRGRFDIIADKTVRMDFDNKPIYKFTRTYKLGFTTLYNGSTADDIQKNGVYCSFFAWDPVGTNVKPLMAFWSRLKYTDA